MNILASLTRIIRFFCFVLTLKSLWLIAKEPSTEISDQPIPVANLEGDPSAFVHNCVNTITGQFCDFNVDLIVHHGVNPIAFSRSYVGNPCKRSTLCRGWATNHHSSMNLSSEYAGLTQDHGGELAFRSTSDAFPMTPKPGSIYYKIKSSTLSKGISNNATGFISGQTNLKNYRIDRQNPKNAVLVTGAGDKSIFRGLKNDEDSLTIHEEHAANGNKLIYSFTRDHHSNYLTGIHQHNSANKEVNTLNLSIINPVEQRKHIAWRIDTQDGRWLQYNFLKESHQSLFLESVESSSNPKLTYEYLINWSEPSKMGQIPLSGHIERKIWPDSRFLNIEYFHFGSNHTPLGHFYFEDKHDARIGRVKTLLAPVGTDATPIPIYQFVYGLHIEEYGKRAGGVLKTPDIILNGGCDVFDALGHHVAYNFNEQHRLNSIVKYDAEGKHYTSEFLCWGNDKTSDATHLKARVLDHHNYGHVFARTYEYDKYGNVIVDSLYGNLSGHNQHQPRMNNDGTPIETGCECHRRTFVYSTDGLNLLLKETDGSNTTSYQYALGTNRLIAKFQGTEKKYLLRWFYEYNEDAAVVKEIHDDGFTQDVNNLKGVTERHITYITQSDKYPVAYPVVIQKKCLDLASGKEMLVHKVVNHYGKNAKVTKQDHFGKGGALRYSLTWEYDDSGNILKETDPIGRTIERRYDTHNNCVFEKGPHPDCHKLFTYDFMNRLIHEEEIHADGIRRSISHRYDLKSRRIATIDVNGNETQYAYDAFNRVVQITSPKVLNETLKPVQLILKKDYDPMGNIVKEIDAKGLETLKGYTLRGQLASAKYPDGTSEIHVYNLDGTIKESRNQNGCRICYTNDSLGRPIAVDTYDPKGEWLHTTKSTYSSFHLLTETDPLGVVTTYDYYPNGKLKSKAKGDSLIQYEYDGLWRLVKTYEYYGPAKTDVIVKVQELDLLDRVLDEKIQDHAGNILTRISYAYDIMGNVCALTTYPEGKTATTTTQFDSHGVPIIITDAIGNQTRTKCLYDWRNELGQCVSYKQIIDALGNTTDMIEDAIGRNVFLIRKNAFMKEIQRQESRFDVNGNCCYIKDTIFTKDAPTREVVTVREYDTANRLLGCYEAVGTPEQKQIKLTYNSLGQKQEIIKGDGIRLKHTYDALGRLSTLASSDKTINYVYNYDLNNNPLRVDDLVHQTFTKRDYHPLGFVQHESLGNGLAMEYLHDNMGRATRVTLSDGTGIAYKYNACFMHAVERLNVNQNTLYTHTYESFDQAGNLNAARLIGQAGIFTQKYDPLGRLTSSTAPFWEENLSRYDAVGNILEVALLDGTTTTSQYSYDDLNQLTSESGKAQHVYTYDSHYNRVSKDGRSHLLNGLHQLLDDGTSKYTYDLNGNLKQKITYDRTTSYVYDALDRLIELQDNDQKVAYVYDENNRRLTKTIKNKETSGTWQTTDEFRYLYQGQNEIGACDGSGKIVELRLLGIGKGAEIGAAVAMEVDGRTYVPIHDHTGSVACLLDGMSGEFVSSYRYSAFGESFNEEGIVPWTYASKRYDPESGFIYFGRRYYAPETGRWITPDPLGREGGPNLYAYVCNSPLTHMDLYGLLGQVNGPLDIISNKISKVGHAIDRAFEAFGDFWRRECPVGFLRDTFSAIHHFCKNGTLRDYQWEFLEPKAIGRYTYGMELGPKQAIIYAPGMNNTYASCVAGAIAVQHAYGDYRVGLLVNRGRGTIMGILETIGQKLGIPGGATRALASMTNAKFAELDGDGRILLIGFSQGGQIINSLKNYLTKDQLSRIDVRTYGSATQISSDSNFGNALNYVSTRDPIPYIGDMPGIISGSFSSNGNTHFLDSSETPFIDHKFLSPTYQKAVSVEGKQFLKIAKGYN